jgi:hypothetical protein
VLKKAGFVVATAIAGLLAVSPLAFAGDDDHKDRRHGDVIVKDNTVKKKTLIKDNEVCTNKQETEAEDATIRNVMPNAFRDAEGVLGVLAPLANVNVQCNKIAVLSND